MKVSRMMAVLAHPVTLGLVSGVAVAATRKRGLATRVLGAQAIGVLASKLVKRAYPRRKPRLWTLTPRESFPSGHATGTSALAAALVDGYGAWRAAPLALAGIAFVDTCRVKDREHRLSEVLVGNAIGVIAAALASVVARATR